MGSASEGGVLACTGRVCQPVFQKHEFCVRTTVILYGKIQSLCPVLIVLEVTVGFVCSTGLVWGDTHTHANTPQSTD